MGPFLYTFFPYQYSIVFQQIKVLFLIRQFSAPQKLKGLLLLLILLSKSVHCIIFLGHEDISWETLKQNVEQEATHTSSEAKPDKDSAGESEKYIVLNILLISA